MTEKIERQNMKINRQRQKRTDRKQDKKINQTTLELDEKFDSDRKKYDRIRSERLERKF
mgnify:CR=1 FL=1